MHLLVLSEAFYPETSGGAHVRWRFCQLAVERGHDVTVFTPHEKGFAKSEIVDGVEIRRPFPVKSDSVPIYSPIAVITRIAASVLFFVYLCWWLRDQDVDGLHSASHLTHWVGKALSVFYDLPLVSFIGYTPSVDADPSLSPQLLLERVNFRFFMGQTVFCRIPRTKEIIERYTDGTVVVLHGILNQKRITDAVSTADRDQRRIDLGIDENETLLVYVGRLAPLKNPVGAIEVLSEFPSEYTLAIVGDGDERETVEQAVREHGVEDRVRICGLLPHGEALETIAAADALVFPSHTESYGAVVFEALALNTTVFARPVGAVPAVDHPRLHVGSLDEFPRLLSGTTIESFDGLDTETLERFSMERYTDGLLGAFEEQTTRETTIGGA
ncbi:glycosyltransferase [Halococcus dombrowskii]|uniref:Glycosyltransferase n=1 Tax=Halococcus dombrowskii TaxID=179637 RepID=A0AAX3AQE4_HALDO|nr:glycosyltransferase [Halococcus dombrowskii]UOO95172.1 glycosyltransferase [Halococcus dombrowskii]